MIWFTLIAWVSFFGACVILGTESIPMWKHILIIILAYSAGYIHGDIEEKKK